MKTKTFLLPVVFNVLLLVCLHLLSGCARGADLNVPTTVLPMSGYYVGVLWLGDWLIVQDSTRATRPQLWRLKPDGTQLEPLPLPTRYSGCIHTGSTGPIRLSDTKLGYLRDCDKLGYEANSLYMMSFDIISQEVTQLSSQALPTQWPPTDAWGWDLERERGIANDRNGREEKLYWITPKEITYLNLGLTFPEDVSWSPNGELIAFMAVPEEDVSSLPLLYNLYVLEPESEEVRILSQGFQRPYGIRWSPDNEWIALAVKPKGFAEKEGLWLLNTTTEDEIFLLEGSFTSPTWSPDGKQLAVIRFPTPPPYINQDTEIVILDLNDLFN